MCWDSQRDIEALQTEKQQLLAALASSQQQLEDKKQQLAATQQQVEALTAQLAAKAAAGTSKLEECIRQWEAKLRSADSASWRTRKTELQQSVQEVWCPIQLSCPRSVESHDADVQQWPTRDYAAMQSGEGRPSR